MPTPCEIVDTTQLRLGDVVHCHGGRFELVSYYADEADAMARANDLRSLRRHYQVTESEIRGALTLRGFNGAFLGTVLEDGTCSIPKSWMEPYWHIQGNDLARWTREVRAA